MRGGVRAGGRIVAILCEENIPPGFNYILAGYGHSTVRAREAGLQDLPDDELLAAVRTHGCDLLLSLDNNRQPEVWSRLINRLANGEGRLVRIKLPKTKVPTVPNLVLPWATAYQEFGALLEDPAVKLIQIGLSLTSQRPAKRGFEAYRQRDLGHLVQQQMRVHEDSLRVRGTPGLNPRPPRPPRR